MRTLMISLISVVCCLINTGLQADDLDATRQLQARLHELDKTAETERSKLTVITTSGFSGEPCNGRRVVPLKDVTERYDRLRADVLAAFDKREQAPLRDWLDENLPKSPSQGNPELRACAKGIPVVGVETADNLWDTLRSKTQRIETEPSLVISLQVSSTPNSNAPFSLRPLYSNETLFEDRTDATLSRVYRGIYRISLTLDGFKPVELQKVNLVDASEDSLQCLLIPNGSPGISTCGLRKRGQR